MNKYILKKLFNFDRRDRRGLLFLSFILLLVIIFYYSIDFFYSSKNKYFDFTEFDSISLIMKKNSYDDNIKSDIREIKDIKINPNSANETELKSIGLNKFQVQNIIKYRNKGGYFYYIHDLKKIYGLNEETYSRVKDNIFIEELPVIVYDNYKRDRESEKVELNTASLQDLLKIKVYKMDIYTKSKVIDNTFLDSSLIKKTALTALNYRKLLKNPYLNKYQVDAITKYISLEKEIKKEDLLKYNILDTSTFKKISYYIELQ